MDCSKKNLLLYLFCEQRIIGALYLLNNSADERFSACVTYRIKTLRSSFRFSIEPQMSELVRKPNKIKGFLVRWYRQTKLYRQEKIYPVESETVFCYIIRGYICARSFQFALRTELSSWRIENPAKERGISRQLSATNLNLCP